MAIVLKMNGDLHCKNIYKFMVKKEETLVEIQRRKCGDTFLGVTGWYNPTCLFYNL